MTRLDEEFEDNVRLSASIKTPVTVVVAPAAPDPKTLVEQRRECVRDVALGLVAKGQGTRVSETRIELFVNWYEFQKEFNKAYPRAGHVMFNTKSSLKRSLRNHPASPEWPHVYLKSGAPKKAIK